VLLVGHGGFEQLEYREDVPVPQPQPGEVLIRVAAAGINNTDINTRIGWYSKRVTEGTTPEGGTAGLVPAAADDGARTGTPRGFPAPPGRGRRRPHRRARPGPRPGAHGPARARRAGGAPGGRRLPLRRRLFRLGGGRRVCRVRDDPRRQRPPHRERSVGCRASV